MEDLGAQQIVLVNCGGELVRCAVTGRQTFDVGDEVSLLMNTQFVYVFDEATGEELTGPRRSYDVRGVVAEEAASK